jgi:hypothetical protein
MPASFLSIKMWHFFSVGEREFSGADAVRLFSDGFVYLLLLTSYDNSELLRDSPFFVGHSRSPFQ